MTEYRSTKIKKHHLGKTGQPIDYIDIRPKALMFLMFSIGLFFLLAKLYVLSLIVFILSVSTWLVNRKPKVVEFYPNFILFKDDRFGDDYFLVMYHEITNWTYVKRAIEADLLNLTLANGKELTYLIYDRKKMLYYLNKNTTCGSIEKETSKGR